MSTQIIVDSKQGAYPVDFFETIDEALSKFDLDLNDYFILIDENIIKRYDKQLEKLLRLPHFEIAANENSKTLDMISQVSEWLIGNGATKSSTILAIGGGIIQDIATFTAHVYKRGIKWEFIPTTLLSQSDSCIGAKCGINVLPYKNQIGVLQSPSRVAIVAEFLPSLPTEDYISGYGEILKLSLTPPHSFLPEFKSSIQNHGFDHNFVLPLIRKSLIAKKAIIEIDEYEDDLRRILNYGHSFGHALEAVTHNKVSHGYGVLFGIDLINYLAMKWGILNDEIRLEIRELIKLHFPLAILPQKVHADELIEAVRTDKKVSSGVMNFAVLDTSMQLKIISKPIDEDLRTLVESYISEDSLFIVG